MQDRGRISLTPYDTEMIIVVRLHGDIHGAAFVDQIMAALTKVTSPGDYNYIIDMRRYEGMTLFDDLAAFAHAWAELVGDQDKGHHSAVISTNPVTRARLPATSQFFPKDIIAVFDTFDEGFDWIREVSSARPSPT